ncbi:GNAT family N-acetyltransferase [Gordonia rhizosphera]|uniref:GNAT family N-acetyltransferase n=1 Tax=Gordonia rhizosphera NBRC 16068 TaxID=1108045 RepID=K6V244_9ACTN|nr:GNAT family N-acyltransferase [Gordonia rhizosphera]GAB90053.1 hypothetical protein GORHZ_082_00030 [Gordonia rhizosphera NBRC 16068]
MTVTTYPAGIRSVPAGARVRPILIAGPLSVELTDDPADIAAVQHLRYQVFAAEPGFSDAIGEPTTQRDADRYDEYCEHLVVRHLDHGLVGCARLLPPDRATAAGGWYTDTEFDAGELDEIRSATVEMGRVCVAPDHRQGSTTALMWAALLHYLEASDHRYLIGCVSVPLGLSGARGSVLRGVRDVVMDRHRAPWQAYPHVRPLVDGRLLDHIGPPANPPIPPLMRAYLRMGAQVCGEPAIDPVFDVGDFVTVLDRLAGNSRYLDRMRAAVGRLAPVARA